MAVPGTSQASVLPDLPGFDTRKVSKPQNTSPLVEREGFVTRRVPGASVLAAEPTTESSAEELNALFTQGIIRDPTPDQALKIRDYRKSTRTVGNMLSAVPGAIGQAASDLGRGAVAAGKAAGQGQGMKIADSVAEGGLRGTTDLGKMVTDIGQGLVIDPIRTKLMGWDPGEVAKQRLLADRKWTQDREAMRQGKEPGHLQDLITVGANALPFIDESLAVKIGQWFAADPEIAEAASYVASPDALVPFLSPVSKASKAAKAVAAPIKPGITQRALRAVAPKVETAAEFTTDVAESIPVVRKAAGISKLAQGGAQALKEVANADWASRVPVWMQVAKNPAAPEWLRRVATEPVNLPQKLRENVLEKWFEWSPKGVMVADKVQPAIEKVAGNAKAVGKGAATGAAIGGGLMALDPNKTGEQIGAGLGVGGAMGAAGGLLARAATRRERAQIKAAHDKFRYVNDAISRGVDPEIVVNTPEPVLDQAFAIETLFKGAFPGGRSIHVQLVGPDTPGLQGGVAGFTALPEPTILLNSGVKDASGRLVHEAIGHALMQSYVGDSPNIIAMVDSMVGPDALANAKRDYAVAMGRRGPEVADYIQQLDAENPYWAHAEIFSEMAAHVLRERDLLAGVETFLGRKGAQSFFRDPSVRDAVTSDAAWMLVTDQLQTLKKFRPGLDETTERGARIHASMAGKHPAFPVEALADGTTGNEFVVMTPDGRAKERPAPQVRRIQRSRKKEVKELFPDAPPVRWGEGTPEVRPRESPSGRVSKFGTKLGDRFYSEAATFGPAAKELAAKVEAAIESGDAVAGWYQEVGKSPNFRGSVRERLGNLEAQFKDYIPYGFEVTKAGNILVKNYSLTAFNRKALQWASREGPLSLDLWGGDVDAFQADVRTYLKNHAEGLPGDASIGEAKRNTINAFLVGDNRTFGETNPLRDRLRKEDKIGIIRSYRLDRLQSIEPSDLGGYVRPDYRKQVMNLSPDVAPNPGDTAVVAE